MRNKIDNSNAIIKSEMAIPYNTLLGESLVVKEQSLDNSYIGKIVDNKDPDKIGRCKVRVFGVFDEVADDDLPWAIGEQSFNGSLVGSFIVPPVGCIVSIVFENGDLYFPKYSRKVVDKNNLPSNYSVNYPNNMVFFETDNGTAFEIDRSNDDVTFTHKSGTKVKFFIDGASGKITVDMDAVDIKMTGKTTITSTSVDVKHSGLWTDNGKAVIPSGSGPYCAMPTCPYSGLALQGYQIVGGI